MQLGDTFILMSDGVIHAGVGKCLNFGWTWKEVSEYALKVEKTIQSSSRLANALTDACNDLYMNNPGDDTTVAVTRITKPQRLYWFTGPPTNPVDDKQMVADFMTGEAKRIVSGGTSANIIGRELQKQVKTSLVYEDNSVPPIAFI